MPDHRSRQTARIVEAAFEIIHAEGMSRLSISKVAATAGVTRQTVYNYFPDVESIVARALGEHIAEIGRQLVDALEQADGLLGKLRAFAEFKISIASPEHAVLDFEHGLSSRIRAELAAHREKVKDVLEQAILRGVEEGLLEDDLIPAVARDLLWGMVEGAMEAAMKHPEQKPYLLDAVVNAMWAALQPVRRDRP